MTIDCNNKPDRVISDVRGDGFLSTVQLTRPQSFVDLSENYLSTVEPFIIAGPTTTAIEEFGREETAEALAILYTELLAPNRINSYNKLVVDRNITDPELGFNALSSIPVTQTPEPLPEFVITTSPLKDAFFQNALPGINERLKFGPLSPIELAEFAREANFSSMDDVVAQSRSNPFSFLNLLNSILAATSLFGALGGICELLSNPFRGLTGIIESSLDKLKKIQDLKDSIMGALDGLLSGGLDLLKSLRDKAFSKISGFIDSIPKMLEGVIDSVKEQFSNLTGKFNDFTSKIAGGLQGNVLKQLGNTIQNKMNQIRNFLSKNNMENLIEKAKSTIGRFAGQFKEMTLEVADMILFNGCKMVGEINDFLSDPIKKAKELLGKADLEVSELTLFSDQNLRSSIEAGRPHMPADEVARVTSDFKQQRRTAATTSVQNQGGYVPPNMHIDVELSKTTHPDPGPGWPNPTSGWDHLVFGAQVLDPVQAGQKFWDATFSINMKDYGGGVIVPKESGIDNGIGYYGIKLEALERAEALGKALVDIGAEELDGAPDSMRQHGKLFCTSGFRHPIYNQYLRNTGVGAAKNSQHMQGKALDFVQGRGKFRGAFVSLASACGFGAIGFYNTFVHIDLRPGPIRWGDSSGSSYVPPNIDEALNNQTPPAEAPANEPVVAPEATETVPPEAAQPQNVRDTARVDNGIPLEPGETLVGWVGDPVTGEPVEKIVKVSGVDADGYEFTSTRTVKL